MRDKNQDGIFSVGSFIVPMLSVGTLPATLRVENCRNTLPQSGEECVPTLSVGTIQFVLADWLVADFFEDVRRWQDEHSND